MGELLNAAGEAGRMIGGLDPQLTDIVLLSLRVSLTAVVWRARWGCRWELRSPSCAFPAGKR